MPKRRGRPMSNYGFRHLGDHLRAVRDLKPELNATKRDKELCAAMVPFWGGRTPDATMVSAELHGSRRLSKDLLSAV